MSSLDDPSIRYDATAGFMVVRPEGVVDADRIIDLNMCVLDHSKFRPGMGVLWDLRMADLSSVTEEDLRLNRDLAEIHAERRGRGRTALLAGDDGPFDLLRTYERIRDLDHVAVATFRSEDEARRWLAAGAAEGEDR